MASSKKVVFSCELCKTQSCTCNKELFEACQQIKSTADAGKCQQSDTNYSKVLEPVFKKCSKSLTVDFYNSKIKNFHINIQKLHKMLATSYFFVVNIDNSVQLGGAKDLGDNVFLIKYFDSNVYGIIKSVGSNCLHTERNIHDVIKYDSLLKNKVVDFIFTNEKIIGDLQENIKCISEENFQIFNLYKSYFALLKEFISYENRNKSLEMQIKNLNDMLNSSSPVKICEDCTKLKESIQNLKSEYNYLLKDYNVSKSEKNKMVMKYAMSEKQVIESQKVAKHAEKKYNDILKEKEYMQKRLAKSQEELGKKCIEVTQVRAQYEHLKDETNMKETKLKWSQNKLKLTIDSQKDNEKKLAESLAKVTELGLDCEKLRAEIIDINKKYQKFEENVITDQQIKEQQARLILDRHVVEDTENEKIRLQMELHSALEKIQNFEKDNKLLLTQVQSLENEIANKNSNLHALNAMQEQQKQEIYELKDIVSNMQLLKKNLDCKEIQISSMENEIKRLSLEKDDLQTEAEANRQREMEMLDFTQKLTDKNVRLQCDFTSIEAKCNYLEKNQEPLQQNLNQCRTKIKELEFKFNHEKIKRHEDCELLAKFSAAQILHSKDLFHKLEDTKGEISLIKNKYELTIREMARELNLYRPKSMQLKKIGQNLSNIE